jgi:hypothetical protein
MKEDYSEKVIELLCEKIDKLEAELKKLKQSSTPFMTDTATNYLTGDGTWTTPTMKYNKLTTTPTTTRSTLCPICHCIPCECGHTTTTTTTTL